MSRFPTIQQLAAAELADVLMLWSGLGYNRRARYLWQSAQIVCAQHDAQLPEDSQQLSGLPGIGKNTAGAIWHMASISPSFS